MYCDVCAYFDSAYNTDVLWCVLTLILHTILMVMCAYFDSAYNTDVLWRVLTLILHTILMYCDVCLL